MEYPEDYQTGTWGASQLEPYDQTKDYGGTTPKPESMPNNLTIMENADDGPDEARVYDKAWWADGDHIGMICASMTVITICFIFCMGLIRLAWGLMW